MIVCICDEKTSEENLYKHVKEDHEMDAFKAFMTTHFKNPDPRVPDSWECMKCKHSKKMETDLISEESCMEHIKNAHFNEAVNEFADSLK